MARASLPHHDRGGGHGPVAASSALVMGIVNVTPDSFWRGSRGSGNQGAELALRLASEGADLLDLGAESSRPGSSYVEAEEEIRRLLPVIEQIRRHSAIPLSIDTRKKAVMEAAWQAGANIVNDISALEDDPELGIFAASHGLTVILMHKRGVPATMQDDPLGGDAFAQVDEYLRRRAQVALSLGIDSDRIWVDPGIGFGKDFQANRVLVAECGRLCGGRHPVVMGLSRKSFIAQLVGRPSVPDDRLAGTVAANMAAAAAGASVLRVHDVAATRDMLMVLENLNIERIDNIR